MGDQSKFQEVAARELAHAEAHADAQDELLAGGVYPDKGDPGEVHGLAGYLPSDPERTPEPHYMRGGIECIDAMRAVSTPADFQAFCRLTAFKYLWRLGEKDTALRESKKALDYARWLHESLAANTPPVRVPGRGRK